MQGCPDMTAKANHGLLWSLSSLSKIRPVRIADAEVGTSWFSHDVQCRESPGQATGAKTDVGGCVLGCSMQGSPGGVAGTMSITFYGLFPFLFYLIIHSLNAFP